MRRISAYKGIAAVLMSISLLTGCSKGTNENTLSVENEDKEVAEYEQGVEKVSEETDIETESATDLDAESEQDVADTREPIRDMDVAYEIILNNCTRDFIGNYPVDETFLGWIQGTYGEEAVERLAEVVESGNQEPESWYELTGNTIHVLWLLYCQDTGLHQDDLVDVYWKECVSKEQTVLDFTGDINLAEGWGTTMHMDQQPNGIYDCFSEDLLEEMNSADIMVVNNEFTYSTKGTPLEGKPYTFRAAPQRAKLLEALGTDIVGLANNHVWDYGEEALIETFETLENINMPYVGAGRNLKEASNIIYFVANGRKIAITAATQIERTLNYTKEATGDMAGVLKTLEPDKYVKVLEEAEKNSDIVIAFVHWGTEHQKFYGSDQANLADKFVAAGADVIIGGHTHCLQGMAYKNGVPIIYSLGNFWFSQSTLDTGLSQVIINQDGSIDFRFLPCIQQNYKTSLVTDETEKQRILDYMERISSDISIDENGFVTDLSQEG